MGGFDESSPRRVIPRWRDSSDIVGTPEQMPHLVRNITRSISNPENELSRLRSDWEANREIPFAADLVGSAFLHGRKDLAEDAAKYLISRKLPLPITLLRMARLLIDGSAAPSVFTENPDSKLAIREARRRLATTLRNPILLVDTARHWSILGQKDKAKKFMKMALNFAPDHRTILRSASRLFIHIGEPDYANWLLRNSSRTAEDPWLLAAEISSASVAGKRSRFIKRAANVFQSGRFPSEHVTELASALGTLEIEEGNNKAAKKLFASSLIMPTDNAVAQAEWASRRQKLDLPVAEAAKKIPRTFEAQFWIDYEREDTKAALGSIHSWIADEPFSSRPTVMGTFVLSIDEDYEKVKTMATKGLLANPDEDQLLNNLIFAEASSGNVKRAWELSAPLIARRSPQILANAGLISYRTGDADLGRQFYEAAIKLALKNSQSSTAAIAAAFFAREALIADDPGASQIVTRAEQLKKRHGSIGLKLIWDRVVEPAKSKRKKIATTERIVLPGLSSSARYIVK